MTIVCGDSHTSTHGAFGAFAFGIGTTQVEHVLATQCLLQEKPATCNIQVDGRLGPGVTAKDIILALISQIGTGGGTGYVLEYTGEAIRALSMEERMTVCNMSIEAGARAGMIAPDATTFEYLAGRPFAPKGIEWNRAIENWSSLATDSMANHDRVIALDVTELEPMISFGTDPSMAIPVTAGIPDPANEPNPGQREALSRALRYMGLNPGDSLLGHPVNVVFVGSCTNSRISDLRLVADLLRRRRIHDRVRMLVVPGSTQVKQRAELEGLDQVFRAAGAEWREAGCSMCVAINDDRLEPGQYAVSTSNRNFEGRQGPGGRTFLASPLTAAAAAISGAICDIRTIIG
jgi:3-isopropylmalate/(R)-2-methylmalate dehydratase large subunit